MSLNIVFPVLNEEVRMLPGIHKTIEYLEKNIAQEWKITIVDNGSTDMTWDQIEDLMHKDSRIEGIRLNERGFGWAWYNAIQKNEADIIGYMDVDLSTDLKHLPEVLKVFAARPEVGIVKGNRLDKRSDVEGRKIGREITSRGLNWIVQTMFQTKICDTMCGFQFFRKEVAVRLAQECSDDKGWFYCAEMLLRADRLHIPVAEIPVKWDDDYGTKVKVFKLIKNYMSRMIILKQDFKKYR